MPLHGVTRGGRGVLGGTLWLDRHAHGTGVAGFFKHDLLAVTNGLIISY